MSAAEPWIVDCHLRDATGASAKEYKCRAAVWAHNDETCRAHLDAFLRTTSYRALRIEACLPAATYTIHEKEQARIGALVGAVNADHLVELSMLDTIDAATQSPIQHLSFKDALLALDHKAAPVFAVLDGAQFDNLPEALFDGDFVNRPLYVDRGENDPEQVITAPHMVWLDERYEKVTGRPYGETVKALFKLIEGKPAAVFWQCPDGADVLYKHLRGINMVLLPKTALPTDDQGIIENDHAPALFRHADANALLQILSGINQAEISRVFGPARRLVFAPDDIWLDRHKYVSLDWSGDWPTPNLGMLEISSRSMERVEKVRENGLKKWAVRYFTDPDTEGFGPSYVEQIQNAFVRAGKYGFEQQEDIWEFIHLDLKHGENFEYNPECEEVRFILEDTTLNAKQRIFYISEECTVALEG